MRRVEQPTQGFDALLKGIQDFYDTL